MDITDLGMALAIIGFVSLIISMVCASLSLHVCEHAGWIGIITLLLAAVIFVTVMLGFV